MKCPYCGAENPVGAAFCGSCGKPISNNASIPQAPNQYQNPTVNQNQGGSYSGSISNQFSPPPPPQPGAIPQSNANLYPNPQAVPGQGAYDPQMAQLQNLEADSKNPWYASTAGLVFFFFIAGPIFCVPLWYLWKKESTGKVVKWTVTVIFIFIELVISSRLYGQ